MCGDDVFKYRKNLMIAGDFNETDSAVIYNNIAIHTPAIAINLYSNALLQQISGNTESYISTVNEPLRLQSMVYYHYDYYDCLCFYINFNTFFLDCMFP